MTEETVAIKTKIKTKTRKIIVSDKCSKQDTRSSSTLPVKYHEKIKHLKEEREKRGLTITQLAFRVDMAPSSIRKYENSGRIPSVESFRKLADFFGWGFVINNNSDIGKPVIYRNPTFSFCPGEKYVFSEYGDKTTYFTYVEKRGKYHIFKNIAGGWETSFTDAQLIGKKFSEVAV